MMRKFYPLFAAIVLMHSAAAQELTVSPDAELSVSAGTVFSVDGLVLAPSARLSLSGLTLHKAMAITRPSPNPYISRVYRFAPGTPEFSGSIQFRYQDGELNGINEASLALNVHNGSMWRSFSTTVDAASNYVVAEGLSSLALGELTLASLLQPLPLTWGRVAANRQGTTVAVEWSTEQEWNVRHFDVERSADGRVWTTAVAGIPAANGSVARHYKQTDVPGYSGPLYYRIRQTDWDGRYSLSKVVLVAAEREVTRFAVSPNPATRYFSLSGIAPAAIGKVELFGATGLLLKTWAGAHNRYDLPPLPAGTYYIRVQVVGGAVYHQQLLVQ